jgi:uncharacterized protein DUF664
MADLLADYDQQCERSREITASHELDERASAHDQHRRSGDPRWIVLHMIEETARHNGHLDIIRETLDGTVGV